MHVCVLQQLKVYIRVEVVNCAELVRQFYRVLRQRVKISAINRLTVRQYKMQRVTTVADNSLYFFSFFMFPLILSGCSSLDYPSSIVFSTVNTSASLFY